MVRSAGAIREASSPGAVALDFASLRETVHKYDYAVIAGANQHPEAGKIVDASQAFSNESKVNDA